MIFKHQRNRLAALLLPLMILLGGLTVKAQVGTPLSSKELVSMLHQLPAHPEKRDEVVEAIRKRGLGFPLSDGLRSLVATKSGNDALLRRTLEEAERRRLNPKESVLPAEAEALELLEQTRIATIAAVEKMPDFLVKQQVTRSLAVGNTSNWRISDRLTIAVSYRASSGEQYKVLTINGLQPNIEAREASDYSDKVGGSTSTGEYVVMLAQLFLPETRAEFKAVDTDLLRGRKTIVYEYLVKKEFSRFQLGWKEKNAATLETITGYRGRVWIDRESKRVLRLETISTEIAPNFPISAASKTVDYDWVTINEEKYLLPTRAVLEMTNRGQQPIYQTRNDILFRGYRKFGSELKIVDIGDDDFVDETEKTPPPAKPPNAPKPGKP
jgi:hypothetical protein